MRINARMAGALALVGLAACGDVLATNNYNNPDIERVLFSEASIYSLVAGLGAQLNNPQRRSESVNTQSKILAEESFASVANFGMAARVANRTLISNELGNDNQVGNLNNYNDFQRVQRLAMTALHAYAGIKARQGGVSLLSDTLENQMRSFAYFVAARALANNAVAYDSMAMLDETNSTSDIPGLVDAVTANNRAIMFYDSALAIASRLAGPGIPGVWLSQTTANIDTATYKRLIRSYRARARVAVARTPAERAAVNWPLVIADATTGITADHVVQIGGTTGWAAQFDAGQMYVTGGWHSVPMKYVGMADSSGQYQAWVATPSASRRAFVVASLDNRWPTGDTRALQQANTPNNVILPKYIRNRPTGDDVVAAGDGESFYDHRRYGSTNASATGGPYTELSKTEIDMLAAEGYLRANNYPAAEALIDISRVRNNLPSVAGVGAGTVPGGAACVPKLPNGTCGTLFEAMKYEKRMETMFTGYMVWFTDSRGWNDLPLNTVVEWPVPYQEMQARQLPYYNGTRRQAGASTYGF